MSDERKQSVLDKVKGALPAADAGPLPTVLTIGAAAALGAGAGHLTKHYVRSHPTLRRHLTMRQRRILGQVMALGLPLAGGATALGLLAAKRRDAQRQALTEAAQGKRRKS